MIDSHAHLDDSRFARDFDAVLNQARQAGVKHIVTVGAGIASSEAAVGLAQRYPDFISASVGIHPHDAGKADEGSLERLRLLMRKDGVVALGETGLDYYYHHSSKESQKALFVRTIAIALETRLPLIVHCRDAHEDCLDILRSYHGKELRGVAHCFGGSARESESFLELGFFISFSGTLTFPKAEQIQEAARTVPLDKVLVETDCPYLSPQPLRGQRNEPAFVSHVVDALARIKGISIPDAIRATTDNAVGLFGERIREPRIHTDGDGTNCLREAD